MKTYIRKKIFLSKKLRYYLFLFFQKMFPSKHLLAFQATFVVTYANPQTNIANSGLHILILRFVGRKKRTKSNYKKIIFKKKKKKKKKLFWKKKKIAIMLLSKKGLLPCYRGFQKKQGSGIFFFAKRTLKFSKILQGFR